MNEEKSEFDEARDTIQALLDEGVIDLGLDVEVYAAYATINGHEPENVDSWSEDAEDAFSGEYESDEDFAYELYESIYDIPSHLANYIDWRLVASDIMMDYTAEADYYFRD